LRGCATGQFIHPLADVAGVFRRPEEIEGRKKVIVPRLCGDGTKGAHGKGVNQLVIKLLIAEGIVSRHALFPTNWLRRKTASGAVRLRQHLGFGVDAEIVAHRLADECFCIHSTRKVRVQIGALRHVFEKGVKRQGTLLAGLIESPGGAAFAILGGRLRLREGMRQKAEEQGRNGQAQSGTVKKGHGGMVQKAGGVFQVYDKKFAHCDAIVILTLVACA
jgi:hypothetical protein